MFEVISTLRADSSRQDFIGRFDCPTAAEREMHRRQKEEPHRAFFLFVHLSERTRIMTAHTLYGGIGQ